MAPFEKVIHFIRAAEKRHDLMLGNQQIGKPVVIERQFGVCANGSNIPIKSARSCPQKIRDFSPDSLLVRERTLSRAGVGLDGKRREPGAGTEKASRKASDGVDPHILFDLAWLKMRRSNIRQARSRQTPRGLLPPRPVLAISPPQTESIPTGVRENRVPVSTNSGRFPRLFKLFFSTLREIALPDLVQNTQGSARDGAFNGSKPQSLWRTRP
jgi:hypothetical protein